MISHEVAICGIDTLVSGNHIKNHSSFLYLSAYLLAVWYRGDQEAWHFQRLLVDL